MSHHKHDPSPSAHDSLLQQVVARAVADTAFRANLLLDPERAVRAAFGTPLPAGRTIRFVERPRGVDLLIVLPDVHDDAGELTDDDLDAAAGGADDCPFTMTW